VTTKSILPIVGLTANGGHFSLNRIIIRKEKQLFLIFCVYSSEPAVRRWKEGE